MKKVRDVITALLAGSLLLLGCTPPAKGQYAMQDLCNRTGELHISGYCISPERPSVTTQNTYGNLILVSYFEAVTSFVVVRKYMVRVFPAESSNEANRLSMILDENRSIEEIVRGTRAVAENNRIAISTSLDLVDAWQPLPNDRF